MLLATDSTTDLTPDSSTALTTYSEVRYAGGVFTIDVDICSALFDYTLELVRFGRADSVTLPSLVAGRRVDSTILLGPHSEIWCSPVLLGLGNIADKRLVTDLRQRIESLQLRGTGVVFDDPTASAADDLDFDY